MTKQSLRQINKRGWPLLVVAIMAMGLIVRVLLAWGMRYSTNGDFGIVALMAKHMAEGTGYPIFCYGVAYMGGLEPLVSALMRFLMKWDGTAFPINLGTALVGVFLLPLVYVLGRDAGSRRAGLIAMLYCVVGSDTLLHYSVAPRGGYMAMMVGGLLALWLACRVVTLENQGGRASAGVFWVIGLAAGIGWWATQLVTVFIVAAGLIGLVGWRRGLLRGVIPGAVGFLLGSLPWWWWNATHEWVSLDFGSSLGKVLFRDGLRSFGRLFLFVVEMGPGTWSGWVRLALLVGLAAGFVWILVGDKIRGKDKKAFYFRLSVPCLFVMMMLFYSTSQYVRANASRYLLPVVPAVAVMIGVVCDRLVQRFRFPWGWIIAGAVMPAHILVMTHMFDGVEADRESWGLASRLDAQVSPLCEGVFLGGYYDFHPLNFSSGEKICIAALPLERYAPYARRAELTAYPAYIKDYSNLSSFLAGTRGASRRLIVDGFPVDYALTPPSNDWGYLDSPAIVSLRDEAQTEWRDVLMDSAVDSVWHVVMPPQSSRRLEFTFARRLPAAGLRLISMHDLYPDVVSIEGRRDALSPWQPLLKPTSGTRYFWSGPYAKLNGVQFFQEFRFPSPDGEISGLRVTFHNPRDYEIPVELGELLVLQQAPGPSAQPPTVDRCVEILRGHGVREVYAPRWLADRVAAAVGGEMKVRASSALSRARDELVALDSSAPAPLTFREKTALIMDERDAPRSRTVLTQAGLSWTETPLGSLVLMTVSGEAPFSTLSGHALAYWTEQGCFLAKVSKAKAHWLYQGALQAKKKTVKEQDMLREAIRLYPFHYPARLALMASLTGSDQPAEMATHKAILKATAWPAVPAEIQFVEGIRFLGMTVKPGKVKPGQAVTLTYYWKCPPKVKQDRWAVFVHIGTGKSRFQDDHVFLQELPPGRLDDQPFEEIVTETRRVLVPATAVPGDYPIVMGLLDRGDNRRVKIRTALKHHGRAVELPVSLTVLP